MTCPSLTGCSAKHTTHVNILLLLLLLLLPLLPPLALAAMEIELCCAAKFDPIVANQRINR